MRIALVTGTSSGIGEALARQLLDRGWLVVGMARRPAPLAHDGYTHLQGDLEDIGSLASVLETRVRPLLADPRITRVGLVNNAALVSLLGPVAMLDPTALLATYTVNTVVPVFLMGWFVRSVAPGVTLRIVNVSTGAASMPLPGLAGYGASKAALRMSGTILAAELDAGAPRDATILSYEPGLVDTPMQTAVRTSSADRLPIVQMFRDWAASGALVPAGLPAREMADYLDTDGHPRWLERRYTPPGG